MRRMHRVVVTSGDQLRILADDWVAPARLKGHVAEFDQPGSDVLVFVDGYSTTTAELAITPPELAEATTAVQVFRELTEVLLHRERQIAKLQIEREKQLNDAWEHLRESHTQALEDINLLGRCITGAKIRSIFSELRSEDRSEGNITAQHLLKGAIRVIRKITPTDNE